MQSNIFTLNDNALFTLVEYDNNNEDCIALYYNCDFNVSCESGIVKVSGINIFNIRYEGQYIIELHVIHDKDFVYGDREFEQAISNAINLNVMFTEAGMQDDNLASMEEA